MAAMEVPDGANERLTTHLSNTGAPSPAFNKEECLEGVSVSRPEQPRLRSERQSSFTLK